AFTLIADTVFNRHPDIVEIDLRRGLRMPAKLFLVGAKADAFHIFFNDQTGNPASAIVAGPGHGDIDFILSAARDKGFGTAEDIIVAVLYRLGLQRRGVGTGSRFGQ